MVVSECNTDFTSLCHSLVLHRIIRLKSMQ